MILFIAKKIFFLDYIQIIIKILMYLFIRVYHTILSIEVLYIQ